jgi:hypothetical protein
MTRSNRLWSSPSCIALGAALLLMGSVTPVAAQEGGLQVDPDLAEESTPATRVFVPITFTPDESSIDAALNTCVLSDLDCARGEGERQTAEAQTDANPADQPADQPTGPQPAAPTVGPFAGTWTGRYAGKYQFGGCAADDAGTITVRAEQPTATAPISGTVSYEGRIAACGSVIQASADNCANARFGPVASNEASVQFTIRCQATENIVLNIESPTVMTGSDTGTDGGGRWATEFRLTKS